jgi:hypothetical protein
MMSLLACSVISLAAGVGRGRGIAEIEHAAAIKLDLCVRALIES